MKKLLLLAILPCLFLASVANAQDTGSVSGVVSDQSQSTGADDPGVPISGAKVTLIQLPSKDEIEVILTGDDGSFNFGDVPFGDYELLIEYPSGLQVSTSAFEVNGDNVAPDFVIPVITEATAPLYGNLRVVNPANTRGDEVSTFAP